MKVSIEMQNGESNFYDDIERINNNEKILTLLNCIYDSAYRCISYTNYFEMITMSSQKSLGNNFLNIVQNVLGDEPCIYWTHIFGDKKNDNHLYYEHFFKLCNEEGYRIEDIIKRLLSVTGYNETEYKVFRENIIEVRNKFLAHKAISNKRNLNEVKNEDINDFSTTYPDLMVCKKMAKELLVILKELVDKWLGDKYDSSWMKNPDNDYYRTLSGHRYTLKFAINELDNQCSDNYKNIIKF